MSYDYGLGGTQNTDYIRVRHQHSSPITLRAFLTQYFNITDESLDEALIHGGLNNKSKVKFFS